MKSTLLVLISITLVTIVGCTQQQAPQDEWVDLFDGETLDGWVQRGGVAKYSVIDGAIVGETVLNTPNSFLCTEKNYSDFILEVEFIVDSRLNSGIQIRSQATNQGKVYGYQVEIDPSLKPYTKQPKNLLADGSEAPPTEARRWSGGIFCEGTKRGWLFNLTRNETARMAFKRDQWNHYRIEAKGDTIKTWVNGVPAADFTDTNEQQRVMTGFIGLQVHGSPTAGLQVKWRNIRIQELN